MGLNSMSHVPILDLTAESILKGFKYKLKLLLFSVTRCTTGPRKVTMNLMMRMIQLNYKRRGTGMNGKMVSLSLKFVFVASPS